MKWQQQQYQNFSYYFQFWERLSSSCRNEKLKWADCKRGVSLCENHPLLLAGLCDWWLLSVNKLKTIFYIYYFTFTCDHVVTINKLTCIFLSCLFLNFWKFDLTERIFNLKQFIFRIKQGLLCVHQLINFSTLMFHRLILFIEKKNLQFCCGFIFSLFVIFK